MSEKSRKNVHVRVVLITQSAEAFEAVPLSNVRGCGDTSPLMSATLSVHPQRPLDHVSPRRVSGHATAKMRRRELTLRIESHSLHKRLGFASIANCFSQSNTSATFRLFMRFLRPHSSLFFRGSLAHSHRLTPGIRCLFFFSETLALLQKEVCNDVRT